MRGKINLLLMMLVAATVMLYGASSMIDGAKAKREQLNTASVRLEQAIEDAQR